MRKVIHERAKKLGIRRNVKRHQARKAHNVEVNQSEPSQVPVLSDRSHHGTSTRSGNDS